MDYILFYLLGDFWGIRNKCLKASNKVSRKIYAFLYKFYNYRNNSYIGLNTVFNSAPVFPHGVRSIFISGDAEIGDNCIIYQQVTIGSNTMPDSTGMGAPKIGNNCLIGAGAMIIGNVKIGDNCRIGANAIVVENVPSNSVVVSPKAKIIQKEKIVNRFYFKNINGKWVYKVGEETIIEEDTEVLIKLDNYKSSELV